MVAASRADTDVVGFYRGAAKSCFVVLHFLSGSLTDRDTQVLPTPMEEDTGEIVSTLVKQYYLNRSALPKEVLLPRSSCHWLLSRSMRPISSAAE